MKKNRFLPIRILIVLAFLAGIVTDTAWADYDLSCFKICLVQMNSSNRTKVANLTKIEDFASTAAAKEAEVICFPELSISGYYRNHPQRLAESIPGETTTRILQIAGRYHIVIIAGLIESEGDLFYISQVVAFPDGRVEKYRKTHLGRMERAVFSAGENLPVFHLKDDIGQEVLFGIGICYDMHFPEVATAYSLKGAHIIFSPHASPFAGPKRISVWNRYLGARAYDNTLYVAACNHLIKGGSKGGGMGVWSYRSAALISEYHGNEERMLLYDLDLATLNRYRKKSSKIFYIKDLRRKLYFKTNQLQP